LQQRGPWAAFWPPTPSLVGLLIAPSLLPWAITYVNEIRLSALFGAAFRWTAGSSCNCKILTPALELLEPRSRRAVDAKLFSNALIL
jgi:hypothetical protein